MTMDERIEAVAPLFYPLIRVVPEAMPSTWDNATDDAKDICRRLARQFLTAAFPELSSDKPGWIAPWEATPEMLQAPLVVSQDDKLRDIMGEPGASKRAATYRAMRDAYLGKGDGG